MKIAIITAAFPFYPGEEFIETEINYWAKNHFNKVYILPARTSGISRKIPENIKLDTTLQKNKINFIFIILAFFSKYLYRELLDLQKKKKINLKRIYEAIKAVAKFIRAERSIMDWLARNEKIDIIYSYWNESYAYAACSIKKRGLVGKVISRAHRFDLYEEHQKYSYMPLKRQFINKFDRIYLISYSAVKYLITTYGADPKNLRLGRLGVTLPTKPNLQRGCDFFTIISLSNIIPVKRIDKIIDSIAALGRIECNIDIKWIHIGDGFLKSQIKTYAEKSFCELANINWEFTGHLENSKVMQFYSDTTVDCIINLSESEGVPLSLMEAMAHGVPAIAPNVGGIAELISDGCGILLTSNPPIDEVVEAYKKIYFHEEINSIQQKSINKINLNFNAEVNYTNFTKSIELLVENTR